MKILVIGQGGREHALCWKIAKSSLCDKLYCAPSNGGISEIAEPVDIKPEDLEALVKFAKDNSIGLTVVGPEVPLVKGIVDIFEKENLRIFGPKRSLANLEGSKIFSKNLMKRLGVPTADFEVFTDSSEALKYLDGKTGPVVVKADGLCAGKGVIVCKTTDQAKDAVKKMMVDRIFGDAGSRILIEECLVGEEASIIVVSDGKNFVPLASSQDHKRVYDNDMGPNTGGMGAYSPAPIVTKALFDNILKSVIAPVIKTLADEGMPYKGALYAGIMITEKGPFVLEFNTRFGDPETQAIMPRLKTDLVEVMERSIDGRLGGYTLEWDERPCVSVVMASGGYPGHYKNGMEISGLDEVKKMKDAVVFHAGTKAGRRATSKGREILTNGGRVLNVTALGKDMKQAIGNCYAAISKISFDSMYYRSDIGARAIRHSAVNTR